MTMLDFVGSMVLGFLYGVIKELNEKIAFAILIACCILLLILCISNGETFSEIIMNRRDWCIFGARVLIFIISSSGGKHSVISMLRYNNEKS